MTTQPPHGHNPFEPPRWPQPAPPPPPPPPSPPGASKPTIVILAIVGFLVVAAVAAGITVAATSGGQESQGSSPRAIASSSPRAPRPTSSSPAVPRVKTNARRNVEVKLGETVVFADRDTGAPEVTFAITKIRIDGRCTGPYREKSQHGHFIFVDLTVTTAPTMSENYGSVLNEFSYSIIGRDGVTETGNALMTEAAGLCQDLDERAPLEVSPGQKYVQTLIFDSRNNSGSLVFSPPYGLDAFNGWEWNIGQQS